MRIGTGTNHFVAAILTPIAVILTLSALTALSACDDDSASPETTAAGEAEEATAPGPTGYGAGGAGGDTEDEPENDPAEDTTTPAPPPRAPEEREVARTVRAYLLGLDAGDGARVCSVLAPGAIEEVELPRDRADCAASVSASIGFRDRRGLPVFESLKLAGVRAIEVGGDAARARATTVTTFADRDEPSIEDDVVYLTRIGAEWRIAKPSAALYRAVGIADVPPSVLAPPAG
ncbi:MAG: hypothetical protein ACRDKX_08705 [Solirubrobacterales bacterium]